MTDQRMILCGGLQSSGSTLVSWCFLQRQDTDGILDMATDKFRESLDLARAPILWCKMTISAFRWLDLYEVYSDLGFAPEPLLVVRDVRPCYASLMTKIYGINGTTAEDPPLRLRFRRFLKDWELFQDKGWPIIKYEDLIQGDERQVLVQACNALGLPWDEGMMSWPKKLSDIAYPCRPNPTFLKSTETGSLTASKRLDKVGFNASKVPSRELEWLESMFESFNAANGYPLHLEAQAAPGTPESMAPPRFEGTRRQQLQAENERLRGNTLRRRAVRRLQREARKVAPSLFAEPSVVGAGSYSDD